jgi:superfamily II DNA/RNA helicase
VPQPDELDLALAAALERPAPPPITFRALGLPPDLVSALASRGIEEPFAIQARALPDALAGRDVLGRGQTGSGKTLAFGLPMLTRLASPAQDGTGRRAAGRPGRAPRGLVIVPTRELARQVAGVLGPLGRPLGLFTLTVYGGAGIGRQIDQLRRGTDVVVATPGRLIDLMERGAVSLAGIEVTVLDEADHLADLGFLPAVTRILDATPAGRQRMLFSATLDRGVGDLVRRYLADPAVHAIVPETTISRTEHRLLTLPSADKVAVAAEIAQRDGRTLFFVRTKHGAARLAKQFDRAGVEAAAIHGNLNQNQRERALAGFAAGQPRVLVATDVAARGLHIDDVGLVVHYDPPNDHKDYLHRSGRTARAGASGLVVSLADEMQATSVSKLHQAAGVTARRDRVATGHEVIRDIAGSGTPIEFPEPSAQELAAAASRAARAERPGGGRRPERRDQPSRGDRPRAGSGDRRGRPGQPGRPGRPGRPAQSGRSSGPYRGGRAA